MGRHSAHEAKPSSPQAKLMDLVGRIMDIFTRRAISAPTSQMMLAVHDLKTMAEEYGDQCAALAVNLAAKEGTLVIAPQAREANGDTGGVPREVASSSGS